MTKNFRNFLLLGVAVIALAACDNSAPPEGALSQENESFNSVMNALDVKQAEPSWAGAYLASRVAQQRLDWPRAEGFLTTVQTIRPDNQTLDRRQMLLAIGSGDVSAAIALAKAQANTPDPRGLTTLVLIMDPLMSNDYARAEESLSTLPKNALGDFAAPLLRAWMRAGENKADLPLVSKNGLYAYHRLLIADLQGRVNEAASDKLIDAAQSSLTPISAERMGDIFLRHQKYDLALRVYRLVELMNPHVPEMKTKIEAAENKSTDLTSLNLTPRVVDARTGIGMAFYDMAATFYNDRSIESALVFANLSLALAPELSEAKLLIGNILADQERPDRAIDIFEKIPETSSRYFAVQQKIASLQVEMGQDDLAIKTLQDLTDKDIPAAQKIDYLMQIGDILREKENFKDALDAYNQASALLDGPPTAENWDLLYARGMTYERLKQWAKAEKDLQAALAFQPDHPYIMNYLGYSWADQGKNLEESLKLLLQAVSIVPDDGYVTDSVGWVYYRQDQFPEAVKYLERAVELLPYDPTINDHLGDAYWQIGRKREAEFQWQRAMNFSKEAEQKVTIEKKLTTGLE